MKKLLFALIFFVLTIFPVNATFNDVSNGHDFSEGIFYLQEKNIIKGYSNGEFRPNDPINRGQFIKIVIGAIYKKEDIDGCANHYGFNNSNLFLDIDSTNTFVNYICVAKTRNIVNGYTDGTFRPDEYIDSFQAGKVLVNAFNIKIDNFTPSKLSDYLNALFENEILKEDENAAILSGVKVTRAEMAWMIYRILLGNNIEFQRRNYIKTYYYNDEPISMVYQFKYPSNWMATNEVTPYQGKIYDYSNSNIKKEVLVYKTSFSYTIKELIPGLTEGFINQKFLYAYNGVDEFGKAAVYKYLENNYEFMEGGKYYYIRIIMDEVPSNNNTLAYNYFILKLESISPLDDTTLNSNMEELELLFKSINQAAG